MEHLFSLCTRLHDLLENQGDLEEFEEDFVIDKELNLDVSTQELVSAERGFTYADLYAMIGNENTIAWLTPSASLTRRGAKVEDYSEWLEEPGACKCGFTADDGKHISAVACSSEALSEICDVVLRLLTASDVHRVELTGSDECECSPFDAPSLAYLMEQCQSLKALRLAWEISLDEDHCRVLGGYSRPGLEIEIIHCRITSAGASALA
jgi:hypothetical protein